MITTFRSLMCLGLLVLLLNQVQAQQAPLIHQVELGENLFRISLKYNVRLEVLRDWNNLENNEIKEGQKLIVGYVDSEDDQSRLNNNNKGSAALVESYGFNERLARIVEQIEALYYQSIAVENKPSEFLDTAQINTLFRAKYAENYLFELQNEFNLAQIKALEDDIGVDLYSSFTHNFRPGIFESEDLFFQNRANIGLDWRLLGNGLLGRKNEIDQLKIENEINDLLKLKDQRSQNYVYNYNYIIYLFNQVQISFIERRLSILNQYLDIAAQMYLVRATPWEDVIELKSKKGSLENMLSNLQNYNEGFDKAYADLSFDTSLKAALFPILELMPEKVFSGPDYEQLNQSLLRLEREKLNLEYQKNKDLNLRTYFRYNAFSDDNQLWRTYGSVGATFTAPLFRNRRNQMLKERRMAVRESELQNAATAVNNELMNHYYEYEYTLKQLIDFYGKKEVSLEKLRKELAKSTYDTPNFTPISTISALDELYAVEFELLDLKQKLYLKLLKVHSLLDVDDISELTTPLEINAIFDRSVGHRSVYVWSATLSQFPNDFLLKYAENNDFGRWFISPGETDSVQLADLIYRSGETKTYRLIGNNRAVETGDFDFLLKQVEEAMTLGFDGVQLDVEPHTLADWDMKKDIYFQRFSALIEQVRNVIGENKLLSLSLPLFYPEMFLEQVAPFTDEMIFMAYERPEIDFIVDQLREEMQVVPNQVSLAIRTDDFEDRIALESFAKKLINATGIANLSIHDLGSLIQLDQKTILGK